jgi:hypothetical protein
MHTHKGIFYFGTYEDAEQWAVNHDWPTGFIRDFERGFAVQSGDFGNYAGPFLSPVTWAEAFESRHASL